MGNIKYAVNYDFDNILFNGIDTTVIKVIKVNLDNDHKTNKANDLSIRRSAFISIYRCEFYNTQNKAIKAIENKIHTRYCERKNYIDISFNEYLKYMKSRIEIYLDIPSKYFAITLIQ